jgi:hypothetical protein
MTYSGFSLSELVRRFGLEFRDNATVIANFLPIEPSPMLLSWLAEGAQLAVAQSTEKARSEFIIAPILLEVRRLLAHRITLFSGIEFEVDKANGLTGVCDFLFARSQQQTFLESPVLCVVEAKNESFKQGVAQAGAEMLAAQMFNSQDQRPQPCIFGAVTIGDQWQFLKLEHNVLSLEAKKYDLDEISSILGILVKMLEETEALAVVA